MQSLLSVIVVLVFLSGVFWLMLGRGRSLSDPSAVSRAWAEATSGTESVKLGTPLIIFKGILAAMAISELTAAQPGSNAALGSTLAIVTVLMAHSKFLYLVAGVMFSLVGYIAAIPQILAFAGAAEDCGFLIPPAGRIAILALLAILFAFSAFASILMTPIDTVRAGVLHAGLALYGGVSLLLYLATIPVIVSPAAPLVIGILGACFLGAVVPRFPNLIEVISSTMLVLISLLWFVEPRLNPGSALPDSCLAVNLDLTLITGFLGTGLVMLIFVRIIRAIKGRAS